MDSPYNTEGDRDNLSINSFGFSEGYLIPSSEVQDNTMRETFTNMSNDKEYDLLGNNCATTVQKVMKTAGLKTYNDKQKKYRVPDNRSLGESSFTGHCPRFCVNRKLEDSSFILESCFQI
jgi:hypothetical protein